jgi:flagellar biosynthesis protein FlhG
VNDPENEPSSDADIRVDVDDPLDPVAGNPFLEAPDDAPMWMLGRKLLVVGGGRGGVGKSVLAGGLAVYFAQLGKSVVLVDGDSTGGNLHSHFGLLAASKEPPVSPEAQNEFAAALLPTSVPGLRLLPAAHDALALRSSLRGARKSRWLSRLRALSADYLVIDVGPGHGHFALDVMLAADVAICVTVPEPPAIEETYRFLRAAYRRRIRRALAGDKFRLALLDRAMNEIGVLPAPLTLVRTLARSDRTLAGIAWAEANRMRMQLVVNQTRVRSDLELGGAMSALARRHYGLSLDELGHVEHDDTVWLAVRRNRPLLVDSPTSKAARNVERIARRVLALTTALRQPEEIAGPLPELGSPPSGSGSSGSSGPNSSRTGSVPPPDPDVQASLPRPGQPPTHYVALGVSRSSNDEEIRRAYKRQREIYASGSLATSSLFDEEELKVEQSRLDEAYDTLLDAVRRRAYDLSTFHEEDRPDQDVGRVRPSLDAEQILLQGDLAREIGPDTEFTGALLRKVRESQGVELSEISSRTKIARTHLAAIEDEAWSALPAAVYVRGFVHEVAKFLKLDAAQVQKTYLRRMRASLPPQADAALNERSALVAGRKSGA